MARAMVDPAELRRFARDLSRFNAVGDLQGGVEEAERLLGYRVRLLPDEAVEGSRSS